MRRPRVRITVCGLMFAVALVGLNLAASIATSKHYPRKVYLPVIISNGDEHGRTMYYGDGSVIYYEGDPFDNKMPLEDRPHVVVRPPRPPPPSILRIWSPVIASGTVTLLALVVAWRRATSKRGADPSGADGADV